MIVECFAEVKKERQITGRALGEASGIAESRISDFINGKRDITIATLWVLLEGMEKLSQGSIEAFGLLLAGKSQVRLTEDQIADQIIALGKAWKELQDSKQGSYVK